MKQGPIYPQADGGTRWIWTFGQRDERRVYVNEESDSISGAGSVIGTGATSRDVQRAVAATREAIEEGRM